MASPRVSYSAARTQPSSTAPLVWEGEPSAHPSVRLKWARKARGWTQEDLAIESGITQGTLTKLERGVAASRTRSWKLLAIALNMRLDSLVSDPTAEIVPALSKN